MKVNMEYYGNGEKKLFDLTPLGITAEGAITLLRMGRTVGWVMEPGDATRYRLIFIPPWSSPHIHMASGPGIDDGRGWLTLVYMGRYGGGVVVNRFCLKYDLDDLTKNEWSQRIISALVRGIFDCINDPTIHADDYVFEEDPNTKETADA